MSIDDSWKLSHVLGVRSQVVPCVLARPSEISVRKDNGDWFVSPFEWDELAAEFDDGFVGLVVEAVQEYVQRRLTD